jgi:carbon-monoxide dehydrogenase small subunit
MRPATTPIHFLLNGERVSADVQPHETILETIRNRFGLYGARESCGQGLCGCCTVNIDGTPVSGCLSLALLADGCQVTTIEEPKDQENGLDEVQQAFIDCGALQCGFCTSGFILMSRDLLDRNPDPSDSEIRHQLCGNLCRCAAYPEIIGAVKQAARMRQASRAEAQKVEA